MSEDNGMLTIPDELLSSVAGGVLSPAEWDRLTEITCGWRDNGVPRDVVEQLWQGWAKDHADAEDWPRIEGIINEAYAS